MDNNNIEFNKNNKTLEPVIDENGKGVLLLLVGLMILLSFLMVNSYPLPNTEKNEGMSSNKEATQPSNEIINTSEKNEPKSREVIQSDVRMI